MKFLVLRLILTVFALTVHVVMLGIIYLAAFATFSVFSPSERFPALELIAWGFGAWLINDCWKSAGRAAAKELNSSDR
jgi:biotin transporter BioY